MSRRRIVVLSSAAALFAVGLIVVLVFAALTQTTYGRERMRELVLARIASRVNGTMYVGRIGGGLLTGVTIDSLEIRGTNDSLLLATGPIRVTYDPRDIFDRRILLQHVTVERPVVRLRQFESGEWNFQQIFPEGPESGPRADRAFGDYVVIDSADISGGGADVTLIQPWHADESLRGARRDSAIAANLARTDADIRRSGDGFARVRRWTGATGSLSHVRLADPDSAGKLFVIADLAVTESDPPFVFSNVRGRGLVIEDSLWLDIAHFDLPGSTGSGSGKVVWGSDLPMRYAIDVVGDSVSLADIAWVYPTLPSTGGGTMKLSIRNADDLEELDYTITGMDVRTTGSRLLGSMTFGTGGPVLRVEDVDLEAAPVDFALLRQLNGQPFPVDWAGTLTGRVRGRGGPVDRFVVDAAQLTFRDAHVRGAISRVAGSGELDILYPALSAFHDFRARIDELDMRTLQHLYPEMPALDGFIAGTATLDSSWLDVRFRDAELTHTDGPGQTSHLTGSGRVTYGEEFITYDLDLVADRLAFTTLARSFEAIPLRGVHQGPIRATGTIADLDLAAELTGPAGMFGVDGHFDLFPSGYAARGSGRVSALDPGRLLARADLPQASLNGTFEMDVAGDSLANVAGSFAVELARSMVDHLRVYPSTGRFRVADSRLLVDTISLETTAANIAASGSIALASGVQGSLDYAIGIDSLGGLRRYIVAGAGEDGAGDDPMYRQPLPDSSLLAALGVTGGGADSLAGAVRIDGSIEGSVDRLDVAGGIAGDDLVYGTSTARAVAGSFSLTDVFADPRGSVALHAESVVAGGVELDSVSASASLEEPASGGFDLRIASANAGPAELAGDFDIANDTTTLLIESIVVRPDSTGQWDLASATRVVLAPDGALLDSLLLRHSDAGFIAIYASLPRSRPVDVRLSADSISLAELGVLAQLPMALEGAGRVEMSITGPRLDPEIQATAALTDARIGSVEIEYLNARARYAEREFDVAANFYRSDQPVLTATAVLPMDLSLAPVESRMLDLPLRGSIRADSADLALIETFSPKLTGASGTLSTDIRLGGSWHRPRLDGGLRIASGAVDVATLGVRFERVNADLRFAGDSIEIRRLSAWTRREDGTRGDTASLTGYLRFGDYANPTFNLRLFAREFHAIDQSDVASLDVSASLRLSGAYRDAVLAGDVIIERGQIYIPELIDKRAIDLNDPELYQIVDTSLFANSPLLPDVPSEFVQNLTLQGVRITIGPDVWLRSSEANIQLSGSVNVTRTLAGGLRAGDAARLALEGTLNADRGTYRLNLGLVQRDFQVNSGKVTFFGEPEINPALDITAVHTVRQYNKQDVGIRVNIGGTLNQPELTLASAEGLPISQSDLLSYLVTGAPSFQIANVNPGQTAASVLLPTVGSWVGGQFAGGAFDLVEIQTATDATSQTGLSVRDASENILSGTSLGLGKQFGDRTFVVANAGLCKLVQNDIAGQDIWRILGLKIEHRFNHGYSVEAGVEPASSELLCTVGALRGAVQTPQQLGLDLFRAWTF
ncbi:MAG: translocation/assembly module TamB domain-containing protein [Gemmatimonadaceae bacterium]